MSEAPRKKRFQVHLSTAVVLMIVAGGGLWANLRPKLDYLGHAKFAARYGWPSAAIEAEGVLPRPPEPDFPFTYIQYLKSGFAIDIVVALVILFAVWFVCEWWIRWRRIRILTSHGLKLTYNS